MARKTRTLLLLMGLVGCITGVTSTGSGSNSGMILRVRLEDGSMEKIQVLDTDTDAMTLEKVLQRYTISEGASVQVGTNNKVSDLTKSLGDLGLKNGSLITIRPKPAATKPKPSFTLSEEDEQASNAFQPFPDLAKNYQSALRQKRVRRQGGSSFGELSTLQSALHQVQPQPEGPLKRVYMCHLSAARFQASCLSSGKAQNKVGLLLGTINRERVDNMKKQKARTSLSSTPSAEDYCKVAKVHCLYEPAGDTISDYDATDLLDEEKWNRIRTLASYLGLQPIGWIFTYSNAEDRAKDDGLPVWDKDVETGARLHIAELKLARDAKKDNPPFTTLAMDATSGATEAFQLSDVAVQMVSEGMLLVDEKKTDRHVSTKHAILVDGSETSTLDSVMCLVNTALLSHAGSYAGASGTKKPTKKNGTLTTKTKKALLAAMNSENSTDGPLLQLLCDFSVLVALDSHVTMQDEDLQDLCRVVQKFARGQKQGATVPTKLKRKLMTLVE